MAVYVGDLLTASAAPVSGKPTPTRTWQWLRGSTAISGATSSTYTVTEDDLGANLSVRQTETNIAGSASATSLTVGPVESFTVAQLFASGEEGAWYEPSTTTCFTDTAGTIAATYGQGVARINDSSGNGNHATQVTAGARPILARVPEGGRRNLLVSSYDLNNASWTKINTPSVSASGTDPFGDTAYSVADDFSDFEWIRSASITAATSTNHTVSFFVKKTTSATSFPGFAFAVGGNVQAVGVNTDTGAILDRTVQSGGSANTTVTDYNADWWRIKITRSATSGNALLLDLFPAVMAGGTLSGTWTGSTTGSAIFAAPQLETGSTATAYQKVVDEYDITEAGVTSLEYLSFDGADDHLVMPTITPGTDKVQVFAGVRKITDTTGLNASVIVESSASADANNGAFFLLGRNGFAPAAKYQIGSRGTTFVLAGTNDAAFTAPVTNILTGLSDISGDTATLRVDGTQVAQNTGDQGSGNYLAYPLYIGRRAGSTLPFDGHIYSLVTRFGPNLDAPTIDNMEAYVAAKTGVTL